jgi:N-dimethylarginine dimethylaminohydrolase
MMTRFLMCKPEYFDVSYVINPWMTDNVHRVGHAEAQAQWHKLDEFIRTKADVALVDAQPGLPDMPFTANAGLVLGDHVVLSNFRHTERQGEEAHFERWFVDRGFVVHRAPREISFEGAGDALLDRDRRMVWMGFGHRTDRAAGTSIQKLLGVRVVMLELVDPRFYHLDTCFCPLPGGTILYYPDAFSADTRALLENVIPAAKRIAVPEEDALQFACNAVNVGRTVVLNHASTGLQIALAAAGFETFETPLSEFLRAGGASKCLVLRLEEEPELSYPWWESSRSHGISAKRN